MAAGRGIAGAGGYAARGARRETGPVPRAAVQVTAAKPQSEDSIAERITAESAWFTGTDFAPNPTDRDQRRNMLMSEALALLAGSPGYTMQVCGALVRMLSQEAAEVADLQRAVVEGHPPFAERPALKEHCKQLLLRTVEGERIKAQDVVLLRSLLAYHPRGPEKGRAAEAFGVGVMDWGTKAFVIIRADGQEHFSYQRCVDNYPTERDHIHRTLCELLIAILRLHPSACDSIAKMFSEKFPRIKGKNIKFETHRNWVRNLLFIAGRLPALTEYLLECLIRRMLEIDAEIAKVDIDEDEPKELANGSEVLAQILDISMIHVFEFLQKLLDIAPGAGQAALAASKQAAGQQAGVSDGHLIHTMWAIFDNYVLMTQKVRYVPFLYFYISSIRVSWMENFLILLLRTVHAPNVSLHKRIIALAYIASFLARAKFASTKYVVKTLQYVVQFAKEHMQAAESYMSASDYNKPQVSLFLAAMQTVCYVLCWHAENFSREVLDSGQTALSSFLPAPGTPAGPDALTPLLCSPCRPLGRIFDRIARMFLRVIGPHCPSVVEVLRVHLPRVSPLERACKGFGGGGEDIDADEDEDDERIAGLDGFFPFDPYRLSNSHIFIRDAYRHFDELAVPADDDTSDDESEATGGFQGAGELNARPRLGSAVTMDDEDSDDADFVTPGATQEERGFLPSVGPSPAFQPISGDMDMVSPLFTAMEAAEDDDDFFLPGPSDYAARASNELLSRMCSTSAYKVGLRGPGV